MLTWISNFAALNEPGSVNNVKWLPIQLSDSKQNQILKIDNATVSFGNYEDTKQKKIEFWNESVKANETETFIDRPISQTYSVIAELRTSLLHSPQIFST